MTILTPATETPAGTLMTAVRGDVLVACGFVDHWDGLTARVVERFPDEDWEIGATAATRAVAACSSTTA